MAEIHEDLERQLHVTSDVTDAKGMSTSGDWGAPLSARDGACLSTGWVQKTRSRDQDEQVVKPNTTLCESLDPSDVYDMSHKLRGHALIINQERFSLELRRQGVENRQGTDLDERKINRQLSKMGFRVTSLPNLSARQIKNMCIEMAQKDHSDCDCFVFVILSHGEEGIVFGTDKEIETSELTEPFTAANCPSLANKPKLFFIQACRGSQLDEGAKVRVIHPQQQAFDYTDSVGSEPDFVKLPVQEADFLIAFSTCSGYFSWRNGGCGSWFIQSLCEMLEKHSENMELQRLLTMVNRRVAQNFRSNNEDTPGMKQVPSIASMLTKDVFFTKKEKSKRL